MIIHNPVITGSFQINGNNISSVESIDNVSSSVVLLNDASASFSDRVSTVEGSVTSLNSASSSYALEANISGAFTSVSGSFASDRLLNTTDTLDGDLTVTGKITAQEFHTEFVSASIIYQSGSTQFGNSGDDTHIFTGSVGIGQGTPTDPLTIFGGQTGLSINSATTGDPYIKLRSDGTIKGDLFIDRASQDLFLRTVTSTNLQFATSTQVRAVITSGGSFLVGGQTSGAVYDAGGGGSVEGYWSSQFKSANSTSRTLIGGAGATQGILGFSSPNTSGDQVITAGIYGAMTSDTVGAETGDLKFYTKPSSGNMASNLRMIINSTGNVGIGTDNPTDLLHINMSSVGRDIFFQNSGTYDEEIFYGRSQTSANCAAIRWKNDGLSIHSYGQSYGSQLFIDANTATVGIGTTSPNALLHIHGSGDAVRITSTNSGVGGAQIDLLHFSPSPANNDVMASINMGGYYSGTNQAYFSSIRTVATDIAGRSGQLQFWTVNGGTFSQKMVIDNGGRIGIGTTSPDDMIHVRVSSGDAGLQLNAATQTLRLDQNSIRTITNSSIAIFTNNNTSNGIYISNNGNVGIGTTSPNEKLSVQGSAKFGSLANALNFTDSVSGNTRYIEVGNAGVNGDALFVAHASGYGVAYFGYEAAGDRLIIATDNGGGVNKIDFSLDAGTTTGGSTDNLNGISPALRITNTGTLLNATTSRHATSRSHFVVAGNGTSYTSPDGSQNNVSMVTVENRNTSAASGHAIVLLRANVEGTTSTGPNAGNPFISFDSYNYGGWTAGMDASDNRSFKITNSWADISGTGVELVYNGTAWQANSDERLKENIVNIGPVLDKIGNLRCVKYNFISDDEMPTQYGFIAQDWQENFSEVLSVSNAPNSPIENKLSMKYTETIPILMKAIQELKAEIDQLKAQLNS